MICLGNCNSSTYEFTNQYWSYFDIQCGHMVSQSFLSFVFDPSSYFNNRCKQQNGKTYLWGNFCFTFNRNHLIRKLH